MQQAPTQEQQEIIDLLKHELSELLGQDNSSFENGTFEEQEPLLFEYAIHLEHLANALELAGLTGLAFCTKRLVGNFRHLLDNKQSVPQDLKYPLKEWGSYFLGYLDTLGQEDAEEQQIKQLLVFLSQDNLASAFSEQELKEAKELFNLSDLSITDDEPALPSEVTLEMASLEISPDVRHELLQGMLIELPEQIRTFENSISDFLSSGDFEDLHQAQRIAHTIKGSANLVAISGMANLTHYAEDLLETAAKNLDHVPDGFDDLLIRTSDCLAIAGEYLNRQGPAPEDLQEVIQLQLNWLNKLKNPDAEIESEELLEEITIAEPVRDPEPTTESIETESTEPVEVERAVEPKEKQDTINKAQPKTETAETHEPAEAERYINLAEKTAQELLRISGEMQIANNQINSQISNVETSLDLMQKYHSQIKNMATELEAMIQTQSAMKAASMKYSEDEIDPLEMERFSELHTFSNRLQELTTDSFETVTNIDQQVKDLTTLSHSHKQLNNDNQHILLQMNLLPVKTLSSRLTRCVRQTCRLTGKSAKLEIIGEDLMLDSRVLNRIADPIMHLLRNAIDHGLEKHSHQRSQAGKKEEGLITLSFTNKGDNIEIVCQDDGQGLNYEKITQTAVIRGLLDHDTKAKPALLNQLILMAGFSTRAKATQTSGRGIGLDSVNTEIRALKGHMHISSEEGEGCKISITVPTSILTSHALLVECRDRNLARTYGISSRGVQQIVYLDQKELIRKERRLYFNFGDKEIPVQTLSELLGIVSYEEEHIAALLIVQRHEGTPLAVGVEKIITSQDLVIKPLNKYVYPVPGVIGATILGDGTVSPVIDMNELPSMSLSESELALLQEQRARQILAERAKFIVPPAALIVDDSLSARRSLAQFVSDIGMDVYTAKDGFDAIHVMQEKKPSLMLVDLEMPRMNGLELTAHIRSRAEYHDIPVIMITSRSTKRHKELAQNAGVTTYLTKPWSDDELLNCIQKEIA